MLLQMCLPLLVVSASVAEIAKYSTLTTSFHFSPLCIEILGSCARSLVRRIGSWVMERTGELHNFFLIQKISQRGNAALVMTTIPLPQDWAELATLPDW